jgi:ADP-ribosyl-[dinitrogen reductase] hydrolase
MRKDNAIGMYMGLYIGDAMGIALEFTAPNEGSAVRNMIGGGYHDAAVGEWSDDGAMSSCIADAYIAYKRFAPGAIAQNFKQWKARGTYGTRDYCFDIGNTTSEALAASSNKRPYGGSCSHMSDGNGSLMRVAPHVLFNHMNKTMAIADTVAGGVLTHGTGKCVTYTATFAAELFDGSASPDDKLYASGIDEKDGSVMGCYAQAWHSIAATNNFEAAIVHAVNKGGDADTVGAVTGMIAGRLYGFSSIPQWWLDKLMHADDLLAVANKLYEMGDR